MFKVKKKSSTLGSRRPHFHRRGIKSKPKTATFFIILLSFVLSGCADRLGSRWGKFARPYVLIPGEIKLWSHAFSLGFSSELHFERGLQWENDVISKLTSHHVDTFVGIGLASVSDDRV